MSRKKGDIAEAKAVLFLKKKGFKILEQNYQLKMGEIDIIALHNKTIHFIEVKSGTTFEPIYNITPTKLSKIIKTAQVYLQRNKSDQAYCIDACIVRNNDIEYIENITL